DNFKLIVAERPLQRFPKLMHLRRRRRLMSRIRSYNQAAPDVLVSTRAWNDDAKQSQPSSENEESTAHQLFGGVFRRQRFQAVDPEDGNAILFGLENRDRRVRTYVRIDAGI